MIWVVKRILIMVVIAIWLILGIVAAPIFIFDWLFIGEDWGLLYIDVLIMVLSEF